MEDCIGSLTTISVKGGETFDQHQNFGTLGSSSMHLQRARDNVCLEMHLTLETMALCLYISRKRFFPFYKCRFNRQHELEVLFLRSFAN